MKMTYAEKCRCIILHRFTFYPGGVHFLSVWYDGIKLVNLGNIRQVCIFKDTS